MPAIRIRTTSGWQDLAIQGPQGPVGPAGSGVIVYEQPDPPASPSIGSLWVETDVNVTGGMAAPYSAYWTSASPAYVGGGTWTTNTAAPVRSNPTGAISGAEWICPADGAGRYRIDAWIQLDNAGAGKQAAVRGLKNGATPITTNALARVYNGAAAAYPASAGFIEYDLVAGDAINVQYMHDDTASRTVGYRLRLERLWVP